MSCTKHIILADDDIDDIELFKTAAKECCEDVEVLTAENGPKLLELLENEPVPNLFPLNSNPILIL